MFEFPATLWRTASFEGWTFLSVPLEISDHVSHMTQGVRRGFGSVRVDVTVGRTSWRTSIFPDAKTGSYVLPVKKAVRLAEQVEAGDEVRVRLEMVDL